MLPAVTSHPESLTTDVGSRKNRPVLVPLHAIPKSVVQALEKAIGVALSCKQPMKREQKSITYPPLPAERSLDDGGSMHPAANFSKPCGLCACLLAMQVGSSQDLPQVVDNSGLKIRRRH